MSSLRSRFVSKRAFRRRSYAVAAFNLLARVGQLFGVSL
jgi:hypothetical protein